MDVKVLKENKRNILLMTSLNRRTSEYRLFLEIRRRFKKGSIPTNKFHFCYLDLINKILRENGCNFSWEELYNKYGTFQNSLDLKYNDKKTLVFN